MTNKPYLAVKCPNCSGTCLISHDEFECPSCFGIGVLIIESSTGQIVFQEIFLEDKK